MEIDRFNDRIQNDISNINSLKGFEVIGEAMVYKILDVFGRNSLLSILYQIGSGPGEAIAKRIKEQYDKEEFEILELIEILMNELKEFYSLRIREIQTSKEKIRIIIENYCFLREPIKNREKLKFGKTFCRINKGYFETVFKILLGNKIKKIEINFLENDEERDVCIEELNFYI
ncbi:MAG: hypothetical protein JSV23_03290 [Promethearchaeota archaeon]|nr:MAG: hypothetical protein JSV23_03290 [Candidatus Lokiarchaeota archaeon]